MKPSPPLIAASLALAFGALAAAMQAGRYGPKVLGSPLHKAVDRGDLPAIRRILDSGVSPSLRTYGGQTALGLAVVQDDWPVAELLLARGADINARVYGRSLLWVTAEDDDWDGYDWLTAHGARRDPAADALARKREGLGRGYVPFKTPPARR